MSKAWVRNDVAASLRQATDAAVILVHGETVIVDRADFDLLSSKTWQLRKSRRTSYVYCPAEGKTMQKLIVDPVPGMEVDHINGNGLDNRRANLRLCTREQNKQNSRMGAHNSSGYRGVYFDRCSKHWRAEIYAQGKRHYLGEYGAAPEAAVAYDNAARRLHKEFACVNFPLIGERGAK